MYKKYESYKRTKIIIFFIILIINVLLYSWLIKDNAEFKNIKHVLNDSFAEEYDSLNSVFVMSINYSFPSIDIGFKSQGYFSKDVSLFCILNIDTKKPLDILKFQIPILAQINTRGIAPVSTFSGGYKNENSAKEEIKEEKKEQKSNNTEENNVKDNNNQNNNNQTDNAKADLKNPYLLIYHTHTMEAFAATDNNKYTARYGYDRTDNLNYTVAKVGDFLTDYLIKDGISVLHDKTINDYNYDSSYTRSLETVSKILKEYPSIKAAIDLHRDGYGAVMKPGIESIPALSQLPNQDFRKKYVTTINGENVARISFIIGSRRTKEMNEDWQKNYEFAKQISTELDKMYPGLSLGVQVKPYSEYNQHLLEKSILIELGSNYNTLEEAIASTKYLAKAISEVLKKEMK